MSEEPWSNLARHPDGRPRLLFDDYAALHPERYGEVALPKPPQPQAPHPGHQPVDTPVHPMAPATAMPALPAEVGMDTTAPNLYADGAPFTMVDSVRAVEPLTGRLVSQARPGAPTIDIDAVSGPDPLDAFVVLHSDVWEEFVPAGSTTPSYSLKFSAGQRVPRSAIAGLKVMATERNMPGPMETK